MTKSKRPPRPPEPVEPTRKQVVISRRERVAQRVLLISVGVVGLAVVAVVLVGLIRNGVLAPGQPVAVVNGESVTARDFRKRLRLNYASAQQDAEEEAELSGQPVEPVNPVAVGETTLDEMIQEELVRQAAQERGITVTEADIEDVLRLSFGFEPLGEPFPDPTPFPTLPPTTPTVTSTFVHTLTPTPTLEPTSTSELPLLTPVGTPTSTLPATATQAEVAEGTPDSPATPTATPTRQPPTEADEAAFREAYDRQLAEWDRLAGLTEADARELFEYLVIYRRLIVTFAEDVSDTIEQALVAYILVETQAEAEELLGRLDAGETFAELAAEHSLDEFTAFRGGEIGWVSRELITTFLPGVDADQVFDLPLGEAGGPFQTPQGYYLFVVYDRQADVPLSEVEYVQRQQQEFQSYLTSLRTDAEDSIEIDETWQRFLTVLR